MGPCCNTSAADGPSARRPAPPRAARRAGLLLGAALLLALPGCGERASTGPGDGANRAGAPHASAPPASTHGAGVLEAAGACARCHPHESEGWTRSAHALQGTPRQQPEGGASAAVGARWMQAYVRQGDDGLHRILPRCYDLRDGVWRDVPDVLREIGGLPADGPRMSLRELSERSFDLACSGCHASGAHVRYQPADGRYATTWRSLAIDCGACHGALPGHGEGGSGRATALGRLPPRARTLVCGRCHGGPPVEGDLEPAEAGAFVSRLGERSSLFPDGTASGQVYQLSAFLRSPCHLEGGLACTSCHDPHAPGHRVPAGGDALCTGCHEGFADPRHTHHPPASSGARCLECHMPRLLGGLMHHQRDHRIGIPLPALPGTPDACTACHTDRDETWADAEARRLWGPPDATRLAAVAAIADARRGQVEGARLRPLLGSPDPFFRAAALAYLPGAALLLGDDPLPEVRLAALQAAEHGGSAAEARALLERLAAGEQPLLRARARLALAARGEPLPETHRADLELLLRLDRGEVAPRRHLVRWDLEQGRLAPAAEQLAAWLAFEPLAAEPWLLLAEVRLLQGERAAMETAAVNGVRAAFRGAGGPEQGARLVEGAAARAVSAQRRLLAAALLRAAADHAPLPALRQHFATLLAQLRRTHGV